VASPIIHSPLPQQLAVPRGPHWAQTATEGKSA